MILGCHVNFTSEQLLGSTKQAIDYGANAFMFYTGAPQNTVRKALDENLRDQAFELMKQNGIDLKNVVCHAPYIINLANNKEEEKWQFSINFLKQELSRCKFLGIKSIVVHPGSAVGLEKSVALKNIADALNFIDQVESNNIGVCIDTCHLNDAGYDMGGFDLFLDKFDQIIGVDKIHCVHLNDSKNELAAHKDRHENLGFGTIGFDTLLQVLLNDKIKNVPKILETPYVERLYPPYKFEIEALKKQQYNPNLIQDIINFYK